MSLKVADSKELLVRLVGTESFLSRERLVEYFRAFLMARVKTYIAQSLRENRINIFEIDEKLLEFSNDLLNRLISPTLVKWFGHTVWFKKLWRGKLDRMVKSLQDWGYESTPYEDKEW